MLYFEYFLRLPNGHSHKKFSYFNSKGVCALPEPHQHAKTNVDLKFNPLKQKLV
jgi:hypothetical protein